MDGGFAMTSPAAPVDTTTEFFETIYADATGDASRVPWADERPHPALVRWLDVVAPSLIRCGGRVVVVGCGLGHDVQELHRRGYDVIGFDCSATAIDWARRIDPERAESYVHADLFDLPPGWTHRFDLVVEINTIQALGPDRRPEAMAAIAALVGRVGHLLVICRGDDVPAAPELGPPWPLTPTELLDLAAGVGLSPTGPIADFMDDEDPPVRRLRAAFAREAAT
ncbi:MAG: class I SAM-dependent methyltransferase [Phycisphaerales bacterium]|nr:class I SAM-dependent methyltransferase [Phycisphaerales bacterium]